MKRAPSTRVPFAVVGVAGLVGLALAPPPPADGQPAPLGAAPLDAGELERQMAELQREVESHRARKGRHEAEVEALSAQREAVEARTAERARALYRVTRAGMLPLAGGVHMLLEHMGRIQHLQRLVKADVRAARGLSARALALREELRRIDARIEQSQARYGELERTRAQAAHHMAPAVDYEQALQTSTFQPSQAPAHLGYGGIRVLGGSPSGFDSDFAALKGRLELPVAGDFRAKDTDVGEGPALLFTTSAGASVRAAAEGRVAFADQHTGYGTLLIVDHGDGYYTVYGGLGRVDVHVGDYVGARARIGSVANDGLIFEVRHRTRSLPPRPWLGF
jgi:murein hydrolase activator